MHSRTTRHSASISRRRSPRCCRRVVSKTAAAIAWRSGGATLDLAPLAIFSMGKMMGKLDENLLEVGMLMDNCCFLRQSQIYIYVYIYAYMYICICH